MTSQHIDDVGNLSVLSISNDSSSCDKILDNDFLEENTDVSCSPVETDNTNRHNTKTPLIKCVALFFICMIGCGSYFAFDAPGALQFEIRSIMSSTNDTQISAFQFSTLYSLYAWPNVICPLIGGLLIDGHNFMDNTFLNKFSIGLVSATILFISIVSVGHIIFTIAAFAQIFGLMQFARFVFGCGSESLAVAQNTYSTRWFSDQTTGFLGLNFVFGLQMSISQIGSTVVFQVMHPVFKGIRNVFPSLLDQNVLGWTLVVSMLPLSFAFLSTIVLGNLSHRFKVFPKFKRSETHQQQVSVEQPTSPLPTPLASTSNTQPSIVKSKVFILIVLTCVTFYSAVFPFISLGLPFYKQMFDFSEDDSYFINGLIYILAAVSAPISGLLVDRLTSIRSNVGDFFIVGGIITVLTGHIFLTVGPPLSPYLGVTLIGCGFGVVSSTFWSFVARAVGDDQCGTAFGILQSFLNLSFAVVTLVAGGIIDSYGYFILELFYVTLLSIACVFSSVLFYINFTAHTSVSMSYSSV